MVNLLIQYFIPIVRAADPTIALIDGTNGVSTAKPSDFINMFTTIGFSLAIAMAVILVAIGGYKMMTSQGEAKAIQDAQDQIQNAILGFMLILGAVTIVRIIFNALGLAALV